MLYFVGVGPGDAELMTLRAVRALEEADAIAIADSGKSSAVLGIVEKWIQNKPVCRLPMPMQGERADWETAHDRAAKELFKWLQKYANIAYPVLGDPGIYASSSYLMEKIAPLHPCRVIPGIPAMCALAAQWGIPLCEQRESLHVLDHLPEDGAIPQGNVVLMKAGGNLDALRQAAGRRKICLGSNVGRENQWLGQPEAAGENLPYFTTAIIKS